MKATRPRRNAHVVDLDKLRLEAHEFTIRIAWPGKAAEAHTLVATSLFHALEYLRSRGVDMAHVEHAVKGKLVRIVSADDTDTIFEGEEA